MSTQLVKKGDLEKVIADLIIKEENISNDLSKALEYINDIPLRNVLSRRLTASNNCLTALKSGFIPIENEWFWLTKSKSKWRQKWADQILDTMPDEVKSSWERVKLLGLFKEYGISGARRGDPILAGKLGKQYFFIASWINFPGNLAIGFIAK